MTNCIDKDKAVAHEVPIRGDLTARLAELGRWLTARLAQPGQRRAALAALLDEGRRLAASDIHLEPADSGGDEVCFRVEGVLRRVARIDQAASRELRAAIREAAGRFVPGQFAVEEGRIAWEAAGGRADFSVYLIPQTTGPGNVIIRPAPESGPRVCPARDRKVRGIDQKVFIWQMGKVGSSTVFKSLRPYANPGISLAPVVGESPRWLIHHNLIQTHSIKPLYDVLHHSEEEFVIISLVRDLLARNISTIFQSMNYREPWRNDYFIAGVEEFQAMPYEQQEQAIIGHLRRLNTGSSVSSWYDNLLKSHFYYPDIDRHFIDVYAKPFDWERGFQTYESKSGRVRMIIIRLENLDEVAGELGKFMGLDDFKLRHDNLASYKWYQPIYKKFNSRYKPTVAELQSIYGSKFMNYFYSPGQINSLASRWR
ncbi:MAG: hypothetical protein M0T76_00775 [Desulfobacteraceae bacterium]|nr:hypothetical protein [Desulfobacteraceae bacterium]